MKIILIILAILAVIVLTSHIITKKSESSLETYPYKVIKSFKTFETRIYEPTLFTSIKLPTKDYKQSSSKGFSTLAGYIFGDNIENKKIAMTTPVTMSLEDSVTMMFMVPSTYTKETLPKPNLSQITFEAVPAKHMAAIEFGGWANDTKISKYRLKLTQALNQQGIPHKGKFYFFGYNAPFTLFGRRNEVLVELEETL